MEQEILNFSRTENDPFAEIDLDKPNITEVMREWEQWKPTTLQIILNYVYIALALIKFFLSIGAVLADILLVFLILRFKRLRKNFNIYIVHFAVMNFGNLTISPIFFLVHLLFRSGYKIFLYFYCYIGMIEGIFLYMSFVFAICLGLDWTISQFKPHYLGQIRAAYKFKFIILYCLLVLLCIINSISCNFHDGFAFDLQFYGMPLLIFTLLAMHFVRRRKVLNNDQLKTEHHLWICSIGVGSYIPLYLMDIIYRIFERSIGYNVIPLLACVEYLFSILSILSPIFILIYLIKWDKYVRMAFDTMFKRRVWTYGSDNLDDASDNEEIVEEDGEKNTQSVTNGSGTQNIMVL